jgi:hypothetical protein
MLHMVKFQRLKRLIAYDRLKKIDFRTLRIKSIHSIHSIFINLVRLKNTLYLFFSTKSAVVPFFLFNHSKFTHSIIH